MFTDQVEPQINSNANGFDKEAENQGYDFIDFGDEVFNQVGNPIADQDLYSDSNFGNDDPAFMKMQQEEYERIQRMYKK